MNRKRHEVNNVRISDEEYGRLENKYDLLRNEFTACKRKLDSKCEALLILSQELDQCRSERDQFKLMAEQLRERYQSLKKQLSVPVGLSSTDKQTFKLGSGIQAENVGKLLYESREVVKSQQFEIDDLKQKLSDAQGDIKLLREQIARQRVGTTDEGMNTRHFPAHEREDLVRQLETSREEYLQLERDLQTVLDEKQEFVTERDAYKTKYDRLNQELNYILKGNENRIVDIDALVMENKYLQERMKQMEEERTMALAAVSKYKSLLEKRKTKSCIKLGQSRGGGMVITQKEVHQVLETQGHLMPTPQAMADLQALAGALLDSVNDKNLALSHQRKTNKILGNRVAELEKKLKTLEVAGLWNVPASVSASLEKLKSECEEVKTMVPARQNSDASELSASTEVEHGSDLETVSPLDSTLVTPEHSPTHGPGSATGCAGLGHLELEDLDLLPTKEVSVKDPKFSYLSKTDKGLQQDDLLLPNSLDSSATKDQSHHTFNINSIPNYLDHLDHDCDSHGVSNDELQSGIGQNMIVKGRHEEKSEVKQENDNLAQDDEIQSSMNIENDDLSESPSPNIDDQDNESVIDVYNADKVTETDDSDKNDDLDQDLMDDNKAEMDSFYSENKPEKLIDTGDTDNENEVESEKVGLLMENAAAKMRSITKHLSVSDDEGQVQVTDTVDETVCSDLHTNQEDDSLICPLMQDEEHEQDHDDLRNVEC